MKKQQLLKLRRAIIAFVILAFCINGTLPAYAQYEKVPTAAIAINGKVVNGIDPVIIDGTYYLPFVQLAKILGYNYIKYEQGTATFEVTDGSTKVRATMGGSRAKKSNEYINIDPPRWFNKTAYVSLNAGGALFNTYIYFKPQNGSIQIQKPARQYVVQSGDSLWRIARAHHTTVQAVKAANKLNSNLIVKGQVLQIPPRDQAKEMEPVREKAPVQNDNHTKVFTQREQVIAQAKKYIGAGYKFGATLAEAPKLFDCSSYTQLVFKQNGVDIPRVSRDQASVGTYVKDLQPGDLMFFTDKQLYSDGRVGHVGIYMGNGKMIHASSSLGVDITENVLSNSYWGGNYLFSKRIIK